MIESTAAVRVAAVDAETDAACIDLWAAAVASRDGRPEDPAVRARAAAKFAAARVALVVAPDSHDGIRGFALVTAPGTGGTGDTDTSTDSSGTGTSGAAEPADAAYISLLAVAPSAQGSGLGRALLVAAVDAARDAGHEHCTLHAIEDNAPAVRLYRSAGFRPVGESFPHALSRRPTRTFVV
ncbi:GNAT family N-acetyltransferase [Curtobacterium herbarum]|uniref:N-acetyltransferase domain-containing protein n=1 Tax=Curtobacterium herbarum TaxID=150122 RepID=A0ABP4K982_9MICO|nr:GNAT family N-acetyltransferase [Curtobacterium herbarum]MBM7474710.1 ribosomal-protein-alanine N-acetyltransferase [Curtobacterium herbarum]MCS6545361.1 GNAT family N-acetyltransferase [Curtobacterium herbarum]